MVLSGFPKLEFHFTVIGDVEDRGKRGGHDLALV